ncbi:hypothetical protein ACWIGI_26965 [Nocardia sp. NPDC055321]
MTDQAESEAADTTTAPVVRRRRRWAALIVAGTVLAGAITGASWLLLGDHRSADEIALDDFRTARQSLAKAAGAHYTGQVIDDAGEKFGLDLRVTNIGDFSGTVEVAPGHAMNHLRVGDKNFARAGREVWIAAGVSEDQANSADGKQLSQPATIHDRTLHSELNPSILGTRLDTSVSTGAELVVGDTVTVDDQAATPIVSGAVTTYVRDGRVVRIVNASFDIRVTQLSADQVSTLYGDLLPTVTALADASDTEKELAHELGWSAPCPATCAALATLTSTATPFVEITIPGVTTPGTDTPVAYSIRLRIAGVDTDRPDCAGTVVIPAGESVTVSCAFEAPPGSQINSTLRARPILGQARADQLVKALRDNADCSRAKAANG